MDTIETISARAFMDETEAMRALLSHVEKLATLETEIMPRAKSWTKAIREDGIGHGVEAFLHAYGLNTTEGVALMCLAEALLRIPDVTTADALIRDTFEGRQWENYTGSQDSWLVNLSSWGLLLTGKVIDFGQDAQSGVLRAVRSLVGKMGEPIIREALKKAMTLIGGQFVLGETMEDALKNSESYTKRGYRFSYDILGEGARSDAQAKFYVDSYRAGIALIGKTVPKGTPLFAAPGISVKLSALHARYSLTQKDRVIRELLPRLKEILLQAKQVGVAVAIDAEEASRLDIELVLFEQLLADPALAGWNGIGFVVQAYQKRAFYVIDWLAELAKKYKRTIPVRLVKGAYWDSEIKWSQLLGLPSYPVFTCKEHTDVSYLACADKLLMHRSAFYPQFATHNARTISSIMAVAKSYGWQKDSYEFQRLHGMGEALHDMVIKDAPSRIYAPVGAHKDLLAYLIRRLLENGANSSFVHLLMDKEKTPEEILADPVAVVKSHAAFYNTGIPLPSDMYGMARKNSSGTDFGNMAQLQALQKAVNQPGKAGTVEDTPKNEVTKIIATVKAAYPAWASTPIEKRAATLERAADILEEHRSELIALLAREAGKTLADGVSEVREAADFCRYYAAQARKLFELQSLTSPAGESNVLSLHPRGVFACISPWNFPLAIFTGQIAAALVTGNTVIAKPAEQTPRVAARAVELLHKAGIPQNALQLICGPGETVGAALTADKRIDGIVFTGGTETAQHIAKTLATRGAPLIPFIAETGGQNCMVVDSSALPEQAVDDIMLSAFGSAGQRCSALRVLFLQEDIADDLLKLLAGAMQELRLGDPMDPATDIGPVIDTGAKNALLAHIEAMKKSAKLIAAAPMPAMGGHFVAPHAFEIKNISQLERENFGPILHVIRFKADTLSQVADAINSTGYGLTFGIHSRVDENIRLLASRVHAGNIYVNRSMIGATVGVQPFGGEGLSGTGPKAGGPLYLMRFVIERTLTINTAAIGGNVALLAS
jgi:RHH-type proline utilization regulon transcriptional repressor/proline dehydrogenase/delta 1-pyrroline-5-carboxylate dehydrogenase